VIYGDGCQVRDVLYAQDLVHAFEAARKNVTRTAGEIYNIGGGAENTTSLLELIEMIESLTRRKVLCSYDEARPGDQAIYVSDSRKFRAHTGWKPTTTVEEILRHIYEFWREHRAAISEVYGAGIEELVRPQSVPEPRVVLTGLERTA
jgi:CDP-paratose 2-epimerase